MSLHQSSRIIELSIIIVNYNVKHFLEQCLQSVFRALEGIEAEVIVVDNNSKDGSQQMLKDHFGDRIILLENQDNPGFSKANNQGIHISQGEHVLLLNPDTVVEEHTFSSCLDFMKAHPKAGALGVYMMDGEGEFLPESKRALPTPWVSFYKIFGLAKLFPRSKKFGKYHLTYLNKTQTHPIEILSGAFMWMRKSVLEEIGLLDETFFMYGEDIDLSYRVILAGYENYYFAGTKIIHYKGESTKKGSLNYVRVFYQAMIIFAEKHFGGRAKWLFISSIRLAVYVRALVAILNRIVQRLGFPLIEFGLVYATMFGIQAYWQHYVKYIEGGQYPPEFLWVYLPIYALIFISFLWVGGAYRKPFRLRPILMAPFWGFLTIATGTYMFSGIRNFSRAIVGLSAIFTSLIAIGTRGLINRRDKGSFFFTEERRKRAILIGDEPSIQRVEGLIKGELNYPVEILGGVLPEATKNPGSDWLLGSIVQLPQLLAVYEVDELIFCQEGLTAQFIFQVMDQYKGPQLTFKIVPEQADFIIGPQTILTSRFGRQHYRLDQPEVRRQKRWVDRIGSLALLLSFPLLFWRYQQAGKAIQGLWQVLLGKAQLVGYADTEAQDLPPLKPGLLDLRHRSKTSIELNQEQLDHFYARTYTWELDVEIVWKSWRKVGATQ